MTPSFFEELQKILQDTPVDVWKQYLEFQLWMRTPRCCPKRFVDAAFRSALQSTGGHSRTASRAGNAPSKPRPGAGAGDFGVLGDVVGRLFVQRHFQPNAKQRMDQLGRESARKAYENSIDELTWMTADNQRQHSREAAKITTKIGYPAKWRDYSSLEIRPDDLVGNCMRSAKLEHQRMLDKLGKPVDRLEWAMTPQTVNAYYNPGLNEIVFPAAILQPPFFNPQADDAVNYGGIGGVIGHEISHGFDDQGSKYDGDGNLQELVDRSTIQYFNYEQLRKTYGRSWWKLR